MYGLESIMEANGFSLMIVGMLVVFCALLILMFLMKALKAVHVAMHNRKMAKEKAEGSGSDSPEEIPGVVVAAIAMTLILEGEQVHDDESMVLTLRHMSKPYSNWWQKDIGTGWQAKTTKGRPTVMQTIDPERGTRV